MESQDAIALNDLSHLSNDPDALPNSGPGLDDQNDGQHEFSLPRADGGKDAWLFLAAGFVVEALVWGSLNSDSSILSRLTFNQDFPSPSVSFKNITASMNPSHLIRQGSL